MDVSPFSENYGGPPLVGPFFLEKVCGGRGCKAFYIFKLAKKVDLTASLHFYEYDSSKGKNYSFLPIFHLSFKICCFWNCCLAQLLFLSIFLNFQNTVDIHGSSLPVMSREIWDGRKWSSKYSLWLLYYMLPWIFN